MKSLLTASVLALSIAAGGAAWAQSSPPASKSPSTTSPSATPTMPPAGSKAPAGAMDPVAEAKFKAADKSGKGVIEGADLAPYRAMMAQIDTNKDGKIQREEFAAAVKSGLIK